ncbi:unnamed protein product [Cuscuta europaea]|uniref:Uncharacterized protein n=1 Tax=Cuscuta europaea TaxID=41803 RepID=A0A9P0ZBH8_CUSEU|nr:unnamed protein product [Cuscuta europaea]
MQKFWVLVQFGKLGQQLEFINFIFFCYDNFVCFVFCFFVPFCKTVDLDMGDERIEVTVLDSFVSINGSTSYIASFEMINSESDSWDNGCQDSFCRLTHYVLSI